MAIIGVEIRLLAGGKYLCTVAEDVTSIFVMTKMLAFGRLTNSNAKKIM